MFTCVYVIFTPSLIHYIIPKRDDKWNEEGRAREWYGEDPYGNSHYESLLSLSHSFVSSCINIMLSLSYFYSCLLVFPLSLPYLPILTVPSVTIPFGSWIESISFSPKNRMVTAKERLLSKKICMDRQVISKEKGRYREKLVNIS